MKSPSSFLSSGLNVQTRILAQTIPPMEQTGKDIGVTKTWELKHAPQDLTSPQWVVFLT